jgi:hypothetical protein
MKTEKKQWLTPEATKIEVNDGSSLGLEGLAGVAGS